MNNSRNPRQRNFVLGLIIIGLMIIGFFWLSHRPRLSAVSWSAPSPTLHHQASRNRRELDPGLDDDSFYFKDVSGAAAYAV